MYGAPAGLSYIHEGIVDFPEEFGYGFFLAVNPAFFMGLLFLMAGYFTPSSYDRKGSDRFLADRVLWLGVTILIFIYLINPLMQYALNGFKVPLLNFIWSNPFAGLGFGPL